MSKTVKMESKRINICPSVTSMQMVSQIEDVMLDILYRLPVKSLFRFKCVSKHWFSLISDPSFYRKHSSLQPPPDSSVSAIFFEINILSWHYYPPEFAPVDKPNSGVPDPSLSFLGRDFLVSHSCIGLLLCERLPDYRRGYEYITYCVCNPTTKEYVLLPQPIQQPYFPINSISIAFDPSKSAHYKVVCISGTKSSHCCVNIYSSKTGLWRLSEQGPRIHRMCRKGVFWNGALHWTTGCYQSTLSFHVEKESFQTTKLPPKPTPIEIPRIYKYFGESNGHLYLIETYNVMVTEFHILEMKSDYSQWSVKNSVNFDSVLKAYPEMLVPSVLFYTEKDLKDPCLRISFTGLRFLVRGGGELVLWMCIPGKIIWYRITDGTFGKYCDLATRMYGGCYFGGYSWLEVHSYSNTLSSIRPTSS